MTLDFNELRQNLAEGARLGFEEIKSNHPNETFYAFALYTHDDADSVEVAACSVERFKRLTEKYPAVDQASLRWSTSEWGAGYEGTRAECMPLFHEAMYEAVQTFGFAQTVGRVMGAMVLALHDLDRAGFFGSAGARKSVTLWCNVTDSENAAWFQDESARRLNPPEAYNVFASEYLVMMKDDIKAARGNRNSVYQAFLESLKQI